MMWLCLDLEEWLIYIYPEFGLLLLVGLQWRLLLVKQPRLSPTNISTVLQTFLS